MNKYSSNFLILIDELKKYNTNLKVAILAQAMLESGYGTSKLALDHKNYWGMKWRPEMKGQLAEEMADVHIMLEQLKFVVGNKFEEQLQKKLDRLKEKLR